MEMPKYSLNRDMPGGVVPVVEGGGDAKGNNCILFTAHHSGGERAAGVAGPMGGVSLV